MVNRAVQLTFSNYSTFTTPNTPPSPLVLFSVISQQPSSSQPRRSDKNTNHRSKLPAAALLPQQANTHTMYSQCCWCESSSYPLSHTARSPLVLSLFSFLSPRSTRRILQMFLKGNWHLDLLDLQTLTSRVGFGFQQPLQFWIWIQISFLFFSKEWCTRSLLSTFLGKT